MYGIMEEEKINILFYSILFYVCRFYYYGSTRGQKKAASQKEGEEGGGGGGGGLTPRPLLPSQRGVLGGGDTRLGPSPTPPPKVCQQCWGSGSGTACFWAIRIH
jgi:hypothetical protein